MCVNISANITPESFEEYTIQKRSVPKGTLRFHFFMHFSAYPTGFEFPQAALA